MQPSCFELCNSQTGDRCRLHVLAECFKAADDMIEWRHDTLFFIVFNPTIRVPRRHSFLHRLLAENPSTVSRQSVMFLCHLLDLKLLPLTELSGQAGYFFRGLGPVNLET